MSAPFTERQEGVTRVEVIHHFDGRILVALDLDDVILSKQDEGRTLKLLVYGGTHSEPTTLDEIDRLRETEVAYKALDRERCRLLAMSATELRALEAEVARLTPVVEAAKAWRAIPLRAKNDRVALWAIAAAVDALATSDQPGDAST